MKEKLSRAICRLSDPAPAAPLFAGWGSEETMVTSCLEGVMGDVYADSPVSPNSAMTVLGDFTFFAGAPSREMVSLRLNMLREGETPILTPQSDAWHPIIEEVLGNRGKAGERYAIRKEPDCFDRAHLSTLIAELPRGFDCRAIDRELYEECRRNVWSRDFVSLYQDYGEFSRLGLGYVAVTDGRIVSGASSYSRYRGGIEIEVDTEIGFRRRKLATVCAASLILACLDRGLYPSWDAQNRHSVALAEKLGYHFNRAYRVYELT